MSSDDLGPKVSGAGYLTPELASDLADETASVIELTGAIKWFDVSKGYGFIIPDNGLPDVLLHVTCLRRDGYQTAYEGARVVCEVLQRPKGLQAFRILSMDDSTAIHPATLPPVRARHGDADQRAGAGHGEMVQPLARIRFSHAWRGYAGHLCPHGD